MSVLDRLVNILQSGPTLNIKFGNFVFSPTYINAGLIVLLLFLLVITLAQVRHHFLNWSFRGAIFGIGLGFILALILEGFLMIGGRTVVTEMLGWKNAPKPFLVFLDRGKSKISKILNQNGTVSGYATEIFSPDTIIEEIKNLDPKQRQEIIDSFCRNF